MPDARLQRTRKSYTTPTLTVAMEPCPIPNLVAGENRVVILNPDFAVHVTPSAEVNDALIATCPLCEEVLDADHDCQDATDDADADEPDLWGV